MHHRVAPAATPVKVLRDLRRAANAATEPAQALQLFDLRRCRYLGLAKTHLQHILTAVALNIVRLDAWWTDRPLAKTRISRFAALQQAAA